MVPLVLDALDFLGALRIVWSEVPGCRCVICTALQARAEARQPPVDPKLEQRKKFLSYSIGVKGLATMSADAIETLAGLEERGEFLDMATMSGIRKADAEQLWRELGHLGKQSPPNTDDIPLQLIPAEELRALYPQIREREERARDEIRRRLMAPQRMVYPGDTERARREAERDLAIGRMARGEQ